MVTSYHRNGPAEFTKLLSARAPTPRRRRVAPIGGYVSAHYRMDGLNPVAWRPHHDRGAHGGGRLPCVRQSNQRSVATLQPQRKRSVQMLIVGGPCRRRA